MICNVVATGSTGNAVILNDTILIDCGVPFGALEPHYKKLRLVLLTHIHGDHFNPTTIKRLHFMRPSLRFAVPPWLVKPMRDIGIDRLVLDYCVPDAGKGIMYQNGLTLRCQRIPHDVDNCCWHVHTEDLEKAFYATDCGSLDGIEAKGYDLYLIEANHTQEEIAEREARKLAAGEYSYEARAAATHLSREQAGEWLAQNAAFGRSAVIFLHQHIEREAHDGVVRGSSNDGEAPEDAEAGTAAEC